MSQKKSAGLEPRHGCKKRDTEESGHRARRRRK